MICRIHSAVTGDAGPAPPRSRSTARISSSSRRVLRSTPCRYPLRNIHLRFVFVKLSVLMQCDSFVFYTKENIRKQTEPTGKDASDPVPYFIFFYSKWFVFTRWNIVVTRVPIKHNISYFISYFYCVFLQRITNLRNRV